jgi:hypothetical protein
VKRLLTRLFTVPRWVSLPTAAAALVAVTAVCYPGGLSAAYADLRDADELNGRVEDSKSTARHLGDRLSTLRDRMDYKEELITGLVRGHSTLAAVTAEFVELNRDQEQGLFLQRMRYGDLELTELSALNVLDYVKQRVAADGSSSVVMTRLYAEFERQFGHPAKLN